MDQRQPCSQFKDVYTSVMFNHNILPVTLIVNKISYVPIKLLMNNERNVHFEYTPCRCFKVVSSEKYTEVTLKVKMSCALYE